jgi:hypothetical protein
MSKSFKPRLFVLATSWNDPIDKLKLNELVQSGFDVFSVSRHGGRHPRHIEMNFYTTRGFRNKRFCFLVRKSKKKQQKVIIAIDFAWLASGYYVNSYGLGWLNEKAKWLFALGVDEMYLPNNEEMQMMFKAIKITDLLDVSLCKDEDCPLFIPFVKAARDNHFLEAQLRYTTQGNRFLRVTRKQKEE